MASPYPTPRSDAGPLGLPKRLSRDVTWGRILFLPPELTNPRMIFDPLPFRAHEHAFLPGRKARGAR